LDGGSGSEAASSHEGAVFAEAMPGHGDCVLAGIGDDLIDVTGEGCEHGE
jgi:hypothetical protein